MNFIDAHDFSVDLVLRVLGIPAATYYDWRTARRAPSRRASRGRRAVGHDRRHPRRARVRRHLRLAAGVAGAAPPRRAGGPQARGADHARSTAARAPTCARAGSRGPPGRTPSTPRRRTCWAATSPPPGRTRSGSPTSRASSPWKGCCGWPVFEMPSPTRSSAGIPARERPPSWYFRARLRHLVPRYPRR